MTDADKSTVPTDLKVDDETTAAKETEDAADEDAADAEDADAEDATVGRGVDWPRVVAYAVLPALALVLALVAGYFKYVDNSVRNADVARTESIQAAKDSTIAILSYTPDQVEQQLNDARSLLTGEFRESYTNLINEVVIPGAQEQQISAVASVAASASVSADPNQAVVMVFVNQTVVVGADPPTNTASSVRVALDKVDGQWLISSFEPV